MASDRACSQSASVEELQSRLSVEDSLPHGVVQLGVGNEILPLLREFSVDAVAVCLQAGLDPALLQDPTSLISHAGLGRLLALSVSSTGCDHFGLLLGQRGTILSFGIVGRLMLHSGTLGDALEALERNVCIINRAAIPSLEICDGTAVFSYAVCQPGVDGANQMSEAALALVVNAIRALIGADWRPDEVLLRRKSSSLEPYRRHFGAPVRINQEISAIMFSGADLNRRVPGADPMLHAILEEKINLTRHRQEGDFSDDLRRLLRRHMTGARCSAEAMAGLLAIHRRTLSRRLRRDGSCYREVAGEVRFEVARQLLEDTQISLAQISAALGYSEASAFSRAFRRWTGQTPVSWRHDGPGMQWVGRHDTLLSISPSTVQDPPNAGLCQ